MHRLTRTFVTIVLMLLAPGWAAAAPSGTALGVDPDASAERPKETVTLTVGADIFIGDRVVTGSVGQVQIRFSDETELVVGPNSALVIEDYLLRDDGSAGQLAINALNGTFRFVTGGAAKDRYTIKTPTGTIGVRGTAFDFFVTLSVTSVLLYHGAVEICTQEARCVTLDDLCEVGQYTLGDAVLVGDADGVRSQDRALLREMFAYAVSQRPLLKQFWIDGASRCVNRSTESTVPDAIGDDPDDDQTGSTPDDGGDDDGGNDDPAGCTGRGCGVNNNG